MPSAAPEPNEAPGATQQSPSPGTVMNDLATTAARQSHGSECRLRAGDTVLVSGEEMKLMLLGPDIVGFRPPAALLDPSRSAELAKLQTAMTFLDNAGQRVQRWADSLLDSRSGLVYGATDLITEHFDRFPPQFQEKIIGYVALLCKYGANYVKNRGCVLIPPCAREEFESEVAKLNLPFDWGRFFDHIYCATPQGMRGFAVYATEADERRLRSTIPGFAIVADELQALFDIAASSGGRLSAGERKQFDAHSRTLKRLEAERLSAVFDEHPRPFGMSLRTVIEVSSDATATSGVTISTERVTDIFDQELCEIALLFSQAAAALPTGYENLRAMLEAQSEWCLDRKGDPNWGRGPKSWHSAHHPQDLLEVCILAEEDGWRGQGVPQMYVSQYSEMPSGFESRWAAIQAECAELGATALVLNSLQLYGHRSHFIGAGQKLPNAAGVEHYKIVTNANMTSVNQIRTWGGAIEFATGLAGERVASMAAQLPWIVTIHELSHLYGDSPEFLSGFCEFVEETHAQSGAIYRTAWHFPDMLEDAATFNCCWIPVRAAYLGPLEQHARSDLMLFDRYLSVGAVAIEDFEGRKVTRLLDKEKVLKVAFETGIQMRLWEVGIPTRLHEELFASAGIERAFDPHDRLQEKKIIQAAVQFLEQHEMERLQWQREVIEEAKAVFADERMVAIAEVLKPIVDALPFIKPLTVAYSDRRLRRLVV